MAYAGANVPEVPARQVRYRVYWLTQLDEGLCDCLVQTSKPEDWVEGPAWGFWDRYSFEE